MVVHTETHQLKIIWNLIQENSEALRRAFQTQTDIGQHSFTHSEKIYAFSLPNGFRVTVELQLNILQSFSGIEQRGNKKYLLPEEPS